MLTVALVGCLISAFVATAVEESVDATKEVVKIVANVADDVAGGCEIRRRYKREEGRGSADVRTWRCDRVSLLDASTVAKLAFPGAYL